MEGNRKKIPCTVQILTLNSAHILRRCLESVKDFDDILICDGNSTDDTLKIAREYTDHITKQVDTDEPNVRAKDFAALRNKCFKEGKYDWNFYLDTDEELPARTAEEIRQIASDPNPRYLIYKIPNIILYERREIKYAVPYPGYQMRLVNRKTGAYHTRTPHSRIVFDAKKYPIGYMKNPWYVIIEHGKPGYNPDINYGHIMIEAKHAAKMPLNWYLYWILWKKSIGIIKNFVKTVLLYARHGFKETLPPGIEFLRIKYKWLMIWWSLKLRIKALFRFCA